MVKVKDLASYLHTLLLTKPVPVLTTPVRMGVVLHSSYITTAVAENRRLSESYLHACNHTLLHTVPSVYGKSMSCEYMTVYKDEQL